MGEKGEDRERKREQGKECERESKKGGLGKFYRSLNFAIRKKQPFLSSFKSINY